jgi:adenylosuccinate synthase
MIDDRQHVWVGPEATRFEVSCDACLSKRDGWSDVYAWSLSVHSTVIEGTLRREADVGFTTCRRGHRIVVRRVGRSGRLEHVPATVVVGAQWGDEGKGKIVDLLAQRSDVVCRYQGGPNAGHTIIVGDETFKIRQTPSGVISGKVSVIGGGCVVDPEVLIAELDDLDRRGIDTSVVVLSGNAHLIMPWHIAIDQASERRLGKLQIGTTRRGIGPCYADKASRIGIRVQDVLDPKILRQKIEVALAEKNVWLERVYEVDGFDLDEVATRYEGYAQRLRPIVGDASLLVDQALKDGKDVLFEGAQATLLDLDHGTYPFVTSSNPIASGAATGIGIGPTRIDRVLGVTKAYVTRVGEGPFPSEIEGPDQERLRDLGGEFGTVTGRIRRCGWLDLVALRYAVRVNGITSLALTKLDVLSDFAELPVCVRYALRDGSETPHFPAHQSDFHHARPVWKILPGWEAPLDGAGTRADLPEAARHYVEFVESELEVPVELVGVGAARERVLA